MPRPRTSRTVPSRSTAAGDPKPWIRCARSSRSSASRATSPPRQPEHAPGDDVALPFRRTRRDRATLRVEEEVRPAAVVDRVLRATDERRVWADQLARDVELALVHLAPEELLDRALRARHAAAQDLRQIAVGEEAHRL